MLVVVSVVGVVWVVCWWTTCVVLGWAFRVFEGVGGGVGCRLGRLVACVWSPRVLVRLRLGGVRLRSRLWVVGVTRKDV